MRLMTEGDVLKWIEQSTDTEINEILQAVIRRYNYLYSEWEVMYLALPKKDGRKEAAQQTIRFLEKYL